MHSLNNKEQFVQFTKDGDNMKITQHRKVSGELQWESTTYTLVERARELYSALRKAGFAVGGLV